jgi:hypothetical protein
MILLLAKASGTSSRLMNLLPAFLRAQALVRQCRFVESEIEEN